MKISYLKNDEGAGQWDKFLAESKTVSWSYLLQWRLYSLYYSAEFMVEDLSFVVTDGSPVAICPLYLESISGIMQFSFANAFLPGPLINQNVSSRRRKRVERLCFDHIDSLATKKGVKKCMLVSQALPKTEEHNLFMEYGYLDASINTAVLDLSLDKKSLWSALRKSFKSLINAGIRTFEIVVVDHQNIDYRIHECYRLLHHKTSGRVTRPKETFDIQFKMIQDDNAVLIGLKDGNKFVGFSYFFHRDGCVCYASASDDPDYKTNVPMEHCVIWAAIEYYQDRKFSWFELGWQQFGSQVFDHPSQKDINISFFKRGFPVKLRSLYRGIKYYDLAFMKADLMACVEKISSNYFNKAMQ